MKDLIAKRFLKYILFPLGITIFLTGGTWMSYADDGRNDNNNDFSQKNANVNSNDDDTSHNAGKNCLTSGCHASGENRFYIGGTIYQDPKGKKGMAFL